MYKNLDWLNEMGFGFMTLRRPSKKMVQQFHNEPLSAWRLIELQSVSRIYKTHHLFRDFVDATAYIRIMKKNITVKFQKRAHNPQFLAPGFDKMDLKISCRENKNFRIVLG